MRKVFRPSVVCLWRACILAKWRNFSPLFSRPY